MSLPMLYKTVLAKNQHNLVWQGYEPYQAITSLFEHLAWHSAIFLKEQAQTCKVISVKFSMIVIKIKTDAQIECRNTTINFSADYNHKLFFIAYFCICS